MEFIIKALSPQLILSLLPLILIKLGNFFKNKDTNATGGDDAVGNILIAIAPAISALEDNNTSAFKKGLIVIRETINNYLNNEAS